MIFQPNADKTQLKTVRAKRLVVISAGTFGSPGVLERSGIGAKDVLDKAGVEQIVDLPGVGEHYQGQLFVLSPQTLAQIFVDHPAIFAPYLATADSDTLDAIGRADPDETSSEL